MVEKALTKGPGAQKPASSRSSGSERGSGMAVPPGSIDFSRICDVYGCIVECQDFTSIMNVVAVIAATQKAGKLGVCRIK
jgi:hypothetical protein